MYRVQANLQTADGMIIEKDAELVVLDNFVALPQTIKNGDIDIQVKSENSVIEIEVFGYVRKTITAKELNSTGVAYMNEAVSVIANPLKAKSNNTLLYVLGAFGTIGLLYYATKKPTPKTVKIS